MPRETLLIDADDTLWENNVFFEEAIDVLLALAGPLGYSREYARHILNETELRNIRQHGYGVRSIMSRTRTGCGRSASSFNSSRAVAAS